MSEYRDELEAQLSEAAANVSLWRSLLEHAGFKLLVEEMTTQANLRKEVVCMTPLSSEMGVYAQEWLKGQFAGIKEVLDRPLTRLEEAKREVETLSRQLENESEIEARISAVESRVDTSDNFGE